MMLSARVSLQKRLVLIISLTVVAPLLVASLLLLRYQREAARADLVKSLDLTERLVAQQLRRRADVLRVESRRALGILSDGRIVHREVLGTPQPFLDRAMESSRLDALALVDARGNLVGVAGAPAVRVETIPWSQLALIPQERERVRGLFANRSFYMGYAIPLTSAQDGTRLRLIGVTTLVSWNLDELRTISGVEITFLEGRERRLTTHYDKFGQARLAGRVNLDTLGLKRGSGGVVAFSDARSARRLRGIADIFGREGEGISGLVLLEVDRESAVVDGAGDLVVVWLLIPLALALAVVAGLFISRTVVRPIVKLQASVRRFAATPGSVQTLTLQAPGEVGDLVAAFNVMTAEIQDAFEKIKRIYYSSRKIAATFELPSLFELAAHEVRRTLGAEAGAIWVSEGGSLVCVASSGQTELRIPATLNPMGVEALEESLRSSKAKNVTLSREDFALLFGERKGISTRILVIPLRRDAFLFGALLFFWKERSEPSEQALFLGDALAASLAIQVRNIEFLAEIRTKAALDAELAAAKAVQEQLLPRHASLPGLRMAMRYVAAQQTGGDWFGFFYNRRRHRLDMLVADVTGHGFPSALLAGVFCGAVYAAEEALAETGPADTPEGERLRTLALLFNRVILQTSRQERTVTMALISLSLETGEVVFLNAGHNAPLWLMAKEKKVKALVATGSRLGYAEEPVFDIVNVHLEPGDGLFMYTDGLIENRGPKGALPARKMRGILSETGDAIAAHGLIWDEARRVWEEEPAADDVTTLAITWEGPVEREAWENLDVPGGIPLFVSDNTKPM